MGFGLRCRVSTIRGYGLYSGIEEYVGLGFRVSKIRGAFCGFHTQQYSLHGVYNYWVPLFMEAATSPLESKPKSHQVCWEIVSYFLFDPMGCS